MLKPKKKEEWELRTTQQGTVSTPGIPQGKIMIQISAKNYQTFGQIFDIQEPEKTVEIQLKPPQPQYSSDPDRPPRSRAAEHQHCTSPSAFRRCSMRYL